MSFRLSIAIALLLLASGVGATEIVLRPRASWQGHVVLLGDVAQIKGADEAAAADLAATPLMPAPADGAAQFLRSTEVRDLLAARGIEVRDLRITGATAVTIGPPVTQPVMPPKPQPSASAARVATPPKKAPALKLSEAETQAAVDELNRAVSEYLGHVTGHDLWQVKADPDKAVLAAVHQSRGQLQVSGGKPPWAGHQQFTIADIDQAAVVARVRIDRVEMAVFVIQSVKQGSLIRRADVELRPFIGALPAQAVTALDEVVGKESVQGLRPDSLLQTNQVRPPTIVHRGERVSVRARAEGISVRTYAIAQQDGGLGDLVMVQALEGKERYAARVAGVRELEILAAGSTAAEVASAPSTIR